MRRRRSGITGPCVTPGSADRLLCRPWRSCCTSLGLRTHLIRGLGQAWGIFRQCGPEMAQRWPSFVATYALSRMMPRPSQPRPYGSQRSLCVGPMRKFGDDPMHPHRWLLVAKGLYWPAIPMFTFRAAEDLAAVLLGPAWSSQSNGADCARREARVVG